MFGNKNKLYTHHYVSPHAHTHTIHYVYTESRKHAILVLFWGIKSSYFLQEFYLLWQLWFNVRSCLNLPVYLIYLTVQTFSGFALFYLKMHNIGFREAFKKTKRWNLGKVPNRGGWGSTRWPGIPNLLNRKNCYEWKVSQTPWISEKQYKFSLKIFTC